MQSLNDPTVAKGVLVVIFLVTAIPTISIVKLITSSYLVGIVVYLTLIYALLRYVGRFALYPGSTKYVTEELE